MISHQFTISQCESTNHHAIPLTVNLLILLGGADLGIGGGVLGACKVALRGSTLHISGDSEQVSDRKVAEWGSVERLKIG